MTANRFDLLLKSTCISEFINRFISVLFLCVLTACGGGSGTTFGTGIGGTGGETASTAKPSITVTLSATTVTSAVPATVTVKVLDASGNPVVGQVVSIATEGGLGAPSATSVLTGTGGQQQFLLFAKAGASSGADNVTASATVGGLAVSSKAGFQIAATAATINSFVSDLAAASTLGAYGQSNLTASIGGLAAGTPVTLGVNSLCLSKGKATITPASQTITNGTASFTYRDQGCGATDSKDDVTVSISGSTVSSTTSIALGAPTVGSITFDAALPSTIFLKGSGFTESSTISFLVVDVANNPLPNQTVDMTLTTVAGGLTIDGQANNLVTKKSDSNGKVSVLVSAGTVPTPVRVQATLSGVTPRISTVSSTLAVAVGLPSQLNFSLSQKSLNIEGMNIDGTPNTYTIIASDRLSNPVPLATAINFVAEGGSIEGIKQVQASADGISRVTSNFVSSNPRPSNGRVTVLAYALGEESFLDKNGNNIYDAGEDFMDLGDVFIDRNFDGVYDSTNDQFISLSIAQNGVCAAATSPLLTLDPTIPTRPGTCDGVWGRAYVRRATETVLSTSTARPLWLSGSQPKLDSHCMVVNLFTDAAEATETKFYLMGPGGLYGQTPSGTISFIVADANGVRLNPMAAGTIVTATITTGGPSTVNVEGGSPVPSTLDASDVTLSYSLGSATAGTIFVSFQSPSGLKTTVPLPISTLPASVACTL